MASLINIFTPLESFLADCEYLFKFMNLHVYVQQGSPQAVIEEIVDWNKGIIGIASEGWFAVYITSEAFSSKLHKSMFNDYYCIYVIEVQGGRSTASELEKLSLRVISKTPDKKIKGFMSKLQKHLKHSEEYGMGIGPGNYYSKVFYNYDKVKGKTLWFDFERKITPVSIPISG